MVKGLRRKNITPVERQNILKLLDGGMTPQEVAEEAKRSPSSIYKIENGWKASSRKQAPKDDWEVLMPAMLALENARLLDLHDLDLATFYSRPKEPSWPIDQGRMWRLGNREIAVSLNAEEKLEWTYLRQHLKGDQVWPALEDLKKAMGQDLTTRVELLEAVIQKVASSPKDGGLGWPVIAETGPLFLSMTNIQGTSAVSLYFVFRLFDQVISRSLELPVVGYQRSNFSVVDSRHVDLGGHAVARGITPEQQEASIEYFLTAQDGLRMLPQAQSASGAYRGAESAAKVVKGHIERLRLTLGFPAGSVCDGCRGRVSSAGRDTLSSN